MNAQALSFQSKVVNAQEWRPALPEWAPDIVLDVARRHRTTAKDIMGTSIFNEHVRARAEALMLVAECGEMSGREVARLFDRDWSGVCRLLKAARARRRSL